MSQQKKRNRSNTKRSASNSKSKRLLPEIHSYLRYFAGERINTARAKTLDLDSFVNFLCSYFSYSKPDKLLLTDFTTSATNRFVEHCLSHGEAHSTVARRLATVKHFGSTLSSQYSDFENPAALVKSPRVNNPSPKKISKTEVQKIHSNALSRLKDKDSFIRHRNAILFEVLICTGLRVEEVRTLYRSQLSASLDSINRVATTGRKFRSVLLPKPTQSKMKDYLERRREELRRFYTKLPAREDARLPLFISCYGADQGNPESFLMGAKTVWRAVNELSASTELHPHLLRHAYAIEILEKTGDIRAVANALGHSDLRLSERYNQKNKN